ncbi:DUF4240 domain-containing protein [Streptomyces kebangsaanensis]|uniref:DUF4240 domain-containing protein n=1 Tax=Streptomyces kebangsaanensis TaxID=864058 RepID=UPI0009A11474|nr:DUF4240 domain-containing protein [Streptomyces kebangsaanensis]
MMTEPVFWKIIQVSAATPPDEQCAAIQGRLCRLNPEEIKGFADRLAEILFRLDLKALADIPVAEVVSGSGRPVKQSDDRFLYARCAVVLAGPDAVAGVLSSAEKFSPFTSDEAAVAEELLEVAPAAFEAVSGETWDHIEPHDYETGSNPDGWQNRGE